MSCSPEQAAHLLGWPGVALHPTVLFGSVVTLDVEVHQARVACGDGPQLDGGTLSIWEWPQSAKWAPRPALTLSGLLLVRSNSRRRWRSALTEAVRWRGFGPAAVVMARHSLPERLDALARTEFDLRGVGLVTIGDDGDDGSARLEVPSEPGRVATARRRTLDRWVEELLYQRALDTGRYPRRAQAGLQP